MEIANDGILWWAYLHANGTVQVKRYFDKRDIEEAHENPFCDIVTGPFMAADRDEAYETARVRLT